MSKRDQHTLMILGGIAFGLFLLSNPKCNRGCRTLAEHLITHGIDELIRRSGMNCALCKGGSRESNERSDYKNSPQLVWSVLDGA